MSDSSDEDDQREAESAKRMWVESQPGPSSRQPSRQGYCGYCRVLYSNLDEHLSSLKHLDSVRASSRGSSTVSSASSSRTKLNLLERFLQDVLQHHPHRYKDPRPSHSDLPSISAPPLPKKELDELCFSNDESRSLGTRENLPSSDDASDQQDNQEDDRAHNQSAEGVAASAVQERVSVPMRDQREGGTTPTGLTHPVVPQTPSPNTKNPPPVHRKAHRKTNRRKTSDSSSNSPLHKAPHPRPSPDPRPQGPSEQKPCSGPWGPSERKPCLDPQGPSEQKPCSGPWGPSEQKSCLEPWGPPQLKSCLDPRSPPEQKPWQDPRGPPEQKPWQEPRGPPEQKPWLCWQKKRREAHKETAFSSNPSELMDQTIEEVIQACCYGISSTSCLKEETESFHFSLPVSMETQSDDWDSPVQVALQPSQTPPLVSRVEEQDLSRLMDFQVDLKDQLYSHQLDSTLHREQRGRSGSRMEEGFLTLPIEEVLPVPEYIPESFRGKTWAEIEHEDEEKVEKLVQQFRRERFICYFDSESLARYGRRSRNKRRHGETKETEPDAGILPLLDCEEGESVYMRRRRRRRKRQAFRVASRCQVVKVSHSTQTIQLVVPSVSQMAPETPPTNIPATNQDEAERTPAVQTWRCLPPSYLNIITPLQPRTSLVYLLCSPSNDAPTHTPAPGSTNKRCRKKRRPVDMQGLKVKYKQLPVRFCDLSSNRILKNPPKGLRWRRGSAPSSLPPPCVRQLFRSLSPDLNADRPPGEGASGSSRVKGQRSSDFSHANPFPLSTLSRDAVRMRSRTPQAPPPSPRSRSERGRGRRRDRTCPTPSLRRTRAQVAQLHPRREGLRRAGPGRKVPGPAGSPSPPSPRRGRARRGRGCDRSRR